MKKEDVKTHQQIEFFLLHDLVVNELRLVKRARRVTPVNRGYTINERAALIGRLFRSSLEKVFPEPLFGVSKRPRHQEFMVSIDNAIRERLRLARSTSPAIFQPLQPEVGEIGLLRFDFPSCLTFYIGSYKSSNANRWHRRNGLEPHEIGIGRYCPAMKAAVSWKRRFDAALREIDVTEEEVGPPAPAVNRAQEQLDAALRAAAEAGRL